jgi:hypothetical protein
VRCERAQLELSARMDGASTAALDAALAAHVASCEECRRFEQSARRLRHAARLEPAVVVPDLLPTIMDDVAAEPPPSGGRRRAITTLVGALTAAAVVIAALAILNRAPAPPVGRSEALSILRSRTLLAWTPGIVDDDLADHIARTKGVKATTCVRSDVAWLDSWTDSSGRRHRAPNGMRIPIEVAAIDTSTYVPFVPATERATIESIEGGGAVLGDGGAALRRISSTGVLTFGPTTLDVHGVLDDALVGAHEAVVSRATGRRLGIETVRYVLVELADDASPDAVAERIRDLVGPHGGIRVRRLGDTPRFRHGDAVLPPVRIKELFGEFAAAGQPDGSLRLDEAWTHANIVTADVPVLGDVRCHRRIVPPLRSAMSEIARRGLAGLIDASDFGGCFSPRHLNQEKTGGLSHHSWGIAFDINVSENPFGVQGRLDPRIVAVMERWGFTWGGHWLIPDGMHFEFLQDVS